MRARFRILILVAASAVAWMVAGLVAGVAEFADNSATASNESESVRDVFLLLERGPAEER